MKKILNLSVIIGIALLVFANSAMAQTNNYAEILQKSLFFYEVQESGELNPQNRVSWRSHSAVNDGADVGHDLTGGWYDAGDHVKFNFPMAFSATTLAWGAIDFAEGYTSSGQMPYLKRNLRWVNDYFIKCHTAPNELWGQVGNGSKDHAWWGSAEVMKMPRPSYKIDASNPGSELAAETAAAMAAASIVFSDDDPAYAATLIEHAKQLFNFADKYRGTYSSSITDAAGYYRSYSGYKDELVWGAIWLYRATNDESYLAIAEDLYNNLNTEPQATMRSYKWGLAWDDKSYGCYALMAKLTGKSKYKNDIERHLDYWSDGTSTGERITYTPGGLAYLDVWGALRYSANTSFLAVYYADAATSATKGAKYNDFAMGQLDYILGNNPQNRSYVCGYGNNPPVNPHHRTAHGCWTNNQNGPPSYTRHTLYGALVGGPDRDDSYADDRSNYINNEVACDYNACFTGLVAKMVAEYGGTPLANFPQPEIASDEYFTEAEINSVGSTFTEWSVWANNHTAFPAREGNEYKFQIFIDISEAVPFGYEAKDYIVSSNNGKIVNFTDLLPWDEENNIYYTEVTFKPGVSIWPGGQSEASEEAQMRIRLPYSAPVEAWDASNDWSSQGLDKDLVKTNFIPFYVDGKLEWGQTPTDPVPVESISISPTEVTLELTETAQIVATILPEDASNKTVSYSSSDNTVATVNVSGVVTAINPGSAVITATTADGSKKASCEVTVNEPPFVEVSGVSISIDTLKLDIQQTSRLSALVTPIDATDKNLTWTSNDTSIATVSNNGTVTGVSEGTTAIVVNTSNPDISAICIVVVSEKIVPPVEYDLTTSIIGNGSIDPANGTYVEGTEVSITAIADEGYYFAGWSGDATGTDLEITIVMDSDKTVTATFKKEAGTPCTDATEISVPFTQNGEGEFCWSTSDDIDYINSWNMASVEINGMDFTNTWANTLPEKVNGKYFIYFKALYPWAHFEASTLKGASLSEKGNEISVYPNPFRIACKLRIENPDAIESIEVVNQAGIMVQTVDKSKINNSVAIGYNLNAGVYFVKIKIGNRIQIIKIIKQ